MQPGCRDVDQAACGGRARKTAPASKRCEVAFGDMTRALALQCLSWSLAAVAAPGAWAPVGTRGGTRSRFLFGANETLYSIESNGTMYEASVD